MSNATKTRMHRGTASKPKTKETQALQAAAPVTAAELVWIFAIGCFIGFVAETLFCFIFKGVWESRRAMLYGPFNQVYGFGAVILVLCLKPFLGKPVRQQLAVGAVVGGLFEVGASLFEEIAFGTFSWEYSYMPFALFGNRTNLIYMLMFGILAVLFMRFVFPALRYVVATLPDKGRKAGAVVLAIFFTVNLSLSAVAIHRWTARQQGVPAQSTTQMWLDKTYPNERMEHIYPVMQLRSQLDE